MDEVGAVQGHGVGVAPDGQRRPGIQPEVRVHDIEARAPVAATRPTGRLQVARRAQRAEREQLELDVRQPPEGIDLITNEAPPYRVTRARIQVRDDQGAHAVARLAGRLWAQPLGTSRLAGPPMSAGIFQTGQLPADARSIRFYGGGDVAVSFAGQQTINIASRPWTIRFVTRPEFERSSGAWLTPNSRAGCIASLAPWERVGVRARPTPSPPGRGQG